MAAAMLIMGALYYFLPAPALETEGNGQEMKVSKDAAFTLHFTQKMDKSSVEQSFRLSPRLEGDFVWKNRKTLEYRPRSPLKIGDRYSVKISGAAQSVYRKSLKEKTLVFVVTGPPFVRFTDPAKGEKPPVIAVDRAVTVLFDRPMENAGENAVLQITPPVKGTIKWLAPSAFAFTPEKGWALATEYVLSIPKGLPSLGGGATEEEYRWIFRTPAPRMISPAPAEAMPVLGTEQEMRVKFSQEIDLDKIRPGENALLFPSNDIDAREHPKNDGFFNADVTYGADEKGGTDKTVLVFKPAFPYLSGQEYRFVLKAGLAGLAGMLPMAEDFEWNFRADAAPPATADGSAPVREVRWAEGGAPTVFAEGANPVFRVESDGTAALSVKLCEVPQADYFATEARFGWADYTCAAPPVVYQNKQGDKIVALDLGGLFQRGFQSGIYFIGVEGGGVRKLAHPFMISDALLFLRSSPESTFVWAVDAKTGAPLGGMSLAFLTREGEALAAGKTDDDGVFVLRQELLAGFYVKGLRQFGAEKKWALVSDLWTVPDTGAAPLAAKPDTASAETPGLYLFTDKTRYTPGETLYFTGYYRRGNSGALALPDRARIRMEWEDPEGQKTEDPPRPLLGRYGSFYGEWKIPESSPAGEYHLITGAEDREGALSVETVIAIGKETAAALRVDSLQKEYRAGESVTALLSALSPFGGVAPGMAGRYSLTKIPYFPAGIGEEDVYAFGAWRGEKCLSRKCAAETVVAANRPFAADEQGKSILTLSSAESPLEAGYRYTLRLQGYSDETGVAEAEARFIVRQGTFSLGLAADKYWVRAGDSVHAKIVAADGNGKAVAGKKVNFFLNPVPGAAGESGKKIPVGNGPAVTGEEPVSAALEIGAIPSGDYRLSATADDEGGATVVAEIPLIIINGAPAKSAGIRLIPDRHEYLVGGKAHLLVIPPAGQEKGAAVIVQENKGVGDVQKIALDGEAVEIEIPVREKMASNFFVTAVAWSGAGNLSADTANLVVTPREKEVHIGFTSKVVETDKGRALTLQIKTEDYQKRPVSAEIALIARETGAEGESPWAGREDPLDFFYPVHASRARSFGTEKPVAENPSTAPQTGHGVDKGGGTLYFNPSVRTDSGGIATVQVPLGENESAAAGEIIALAARDADHFGMARATFRTRKSIRIRPDLPPVASPFDRFQVSAELSNDSERDFETRIELIAPGLEIQGDAEKTVILKAGQTLRAGWDVKALPATIAAIPVAFRTRETFVTAELPIRAPEKVAVFSGIVADVWEKIVDESAGFRTGSGRFLLFAGAGLDVFLEKYKTEAGLMDEPENSLLTLAVEIQRSLLAGRYQAAEAAMEKLEAYRQPDGGYAAREHAKTSDPLLSAVALRVLSEAEKAELVTPEKKPAVDYLWNALTTDITPVGETEALSAELKIFLLWALSEAGEYDTGAAIRLYQKADEAPVYSRALLLLTFKNLIAAGQKSLEPFVARLQSELADRTVEEGNRAMVEESPTARYCRSARCQTAAVFMALTRVSPENPLLGSLANQLVLPDPDSASDVFAEIWKLEGFKNRSRGVPAPVAGYSFQADLAGEKILEGTISPEDPGKIFTADISLKEDAEKPALTLRKEGVGPLVFEAVFTGESEGPLSAESNGLILTREMTLIKTTGLAGETKTGDVIRGRLTLLVPEAMEDVVVEAPLPAGMRALAFARSVTDTAWREKREAEASAAGVDTLENPLWHFDYAEVAPDRFLLSAAHLPAGVYTIDFYAEAARAGIYKNPPARAYRLFDPRVFAQSESGVLEIR